MFAITPWVAMLLLASPVSASAGEGADARTLVRRVIRVRGGEARLRRLFAATWQVKATDYTRGRKVETNASVATAPGRVRIAVRGENRGLPFTRTLVLDGDHGWLDDDGNRADLAAAELAEERERLYANELATLVPLLDKDNRVSLLDEKRVGERLAIGLRVERDGRRDVRLYFDKETDLLLAVESTVRDPATGRDVTQEVRFADYRTVDGIKQAMKFVVRWNYHKVAEGSCSDYKFLDRLPEGLLSKP